MQKQTKVVSNYPSLSSDSKRNLERVIGEALATVLINQKSPITSQKFDIS